MSFIGAVELQSSIRTTAGSRLRAALVCGLVVVRALAVEPESSSAKPFTVSDSIAWNHLKTLPAGDSAEAGGVVLFSPDRKAFLLHTRRGDLARNVNVESLLLVRMNDVEAYLASNDARPPVPKTLITVAVGDGDGISDVKWLDDTQVAFLARDPQGRMQAFVSTISARQLRQISRSETPVAAFTVAGNDLFYYAHVPTEPLPLTVSLGERSLGDLIYSAGADETPIELFRSTRGKADVVRLSQAPMRLYARQIWVSPDNSYALVLVPATDAPLRWADYQIPNYELFGYTPDRVTSDPISDQAGFRTRYAVVDLRRGTVRPLLDAPSGALAQNRSPAQVFWLRDGRSVVVSNTYLPLDVADPREREQRAVRPAIAEVDLQSGAITPIVWEPALTDAERAAGKRQEGLILSLEWDREATSLQIRKRSRTGQVEIEHWKKRADHWEQVGGGAAPMAMSAIHIELRQSLSSRPIVYAVGSACTCAKVILDPNPNAGAYEFGRVEAVQWHESTYGIQWKGALVYPSTYVAGMKYPLVVQTHGFNPDRFLLDGPADGQGAGTAMAAQALANAGFVVLQVEDNRQAMTLDEREGMRFAAGYRAGIEELISRGIVDRARIGLIAFSRTGIHALRLMAHYPDLLSAVTLADASHTGYVAQLLLTNLSKDILAQEVKRLGPPPQLLQSEDVGKWFTADPLYRMASAKAAVRLEAIGPGRVFAYWEMYSVLRSFGRVVDFIYFPRGSHVLEKPVERLASQGGNVDWFRFWLADYEDSDPAKVAQYERWRRLRAAAKTH